MFLLRTDFMEEYRTVEKEASDFFIEKKSKFIGYAKPVSTPDEAADFINTIKAMHWDATHNVYAYVLRDNNFQRYSDDGEPSGTAGVPVLDVLLKENLVNVCVVATRYFGGTLLGAGGLVTMAECGIYRCDIDYSFYDRLVVLLNEVGANIEGSDFSDKVKVIFTVKEKYAKILAERLTDVSNGKYRIRRLGRKFDKIG